MDRTPSTRRGDRSKWPVRIFRRGEEPCEDLSASTSAEERLEMVWLLRDRIWELTGKPLPRYARSEMPIRVIAR